VWKWAARGAPGYETMTNVSAELRAALAAEVPFSTLTLERDARSRDGGLDSSVGPARREDDAQEDANAGGGNGHGDAER